MFEKVHLDFSASDLFANLGPADKTNLKQTR